MKFIKFTLLLVFTLVSTSSCIIGMKYDYIDEPVFIELEKIKNNIGILPPKEIKNLGKMYTYKNYIFIGEPNFGIHIIDNSNPKDPKNKAFIRVPFNENISIKDDIMYADNLGDILAIDISKLEQINITKKIALSNYDPKEKIQIGYKNGVNPTYEPLKLDFSGFMLNPATNNYDSTSSPYSIGQGGSLATFSIVGDYLYTIAPSKITVFDIKETKNPSKLGAVKVDNSRNDVETIYAYKDKLFMGASSGAYIYDNKNPQEPTFITKVEHIVKNDPIVVDENNAYVTLNNPSAKVGNELDVIDLSDIQKARIIKTYPMTNPIGLAIKDKKLFICDGKDGLKIFDAKNPLVIKQINTVDIKNPKDIIINDNNQGFIIADDGIHQYDLSNPTQKIEELSLIKVTNNSNQDNGSIFSKGPVIGARETSRPDIKSYDSDEPLTIKEGKINYYKWYKEYFE